MKCLTCNQNADVNDLSYCEVCIESATKHLVEIGAILAQYNEGAIMSVEALNAIAWKCAKAYGQI